MKDKVSKLIADVLDKLLSTGIISADEVQVDSTTVKFIQGLWKYFAIVGFGFTIVYFLMELNRKYAFEATDLTFKTIAVPFIKLVAAIGVLSQGGKIIGLIVEFGNTFITWTGKNFNPHTDSIAALKKSIEKYFDEGLGGLTFFVALIVVLPALLTWLVSVVCQIVWKYKILGYKIELLFRMGISPVALADVYSGQNSQAIRWCKAMLATVMYGASFVLVQKLGHAVALYSIVDEINTSLKGFASAGEAVDTIWDMLGAMLGLVVVPVAEIGCISAIRSALKEALA